MSVKARKRTRGSFKPGDPRCGRPKGCPNKTTKIGREFALGILESEEYRDWLLERVRNKNLAGEIEKLLWYYAVGKPKETVEHEFLGGGIPVRVVERVIVDARRQAQD